MHFVSEILFEFYHVLNILQVLQLDGSLRKFKRMGFNRTSRMFIKDLEINIQRNEITIEIFILLK